MKRDLDAHNEESENKCTSQVSGRCWATLVNSRCPRGGNTQSPQRRLAGPHWLSPSLWFGAEETRIF